MKERGCAGLKGNYTSSSPRRHPMLPDGTATGADVRSEARKQHFPIHVAPRCFPTAQRPKATRDRILAQRVITYIDFQTHTLDPIRLADLVAPGCCAVRKHRTMRLQRFCYLANQSWLTACGQGSVPLDVGSAYV